MILWPEPGPDAGILRGTRLGLGQWLGLGLNPPDCRNQIARPWSDRLAPPTTWRYGEGYIRGRSEGSIGSFVRQGGRITVVKAYVTSGPS